MARLENKTQGKVLSSQLKVADNFFARAVGLMAKKPLSYEEGLWITPCNSIHTYFVRFALDCVFVDKDCKVVAVKPKISPWSLVWPIKNAHSVFEFTSGWLEKNPVQKGDQFYVLR